MLVWVVVMDTDRSALSNLKPGKGRGGGEVRCERYYVVGRERGVAAALQTYQLGLYRRVVVPAALCPRRVVILHQRAWIYNPRHG